MSADLMTQLQLSLARHALGLPNKRRRTYRNRFIGPRGADLEAWRALVAAGDAREGRASQITGGDVWFLLTRQGALKALAKGEKLDLEDFPSEKRA